MLGGEGVDFDEKIMIAHDHALSRVATRTSIYYAGSAPILREATRNATISTMDASPKINRAKVLKAIADTTGPGKKFSRRSLSLAATGDRNPDLVRDLFRVDNRTMQIETIAGLAKALGRDLNEFLEGVEPLPSQDGARFLKVKASVEAGVWREQIDWPADEWYDFEVGPNPEPGSEEFALRLEGYSMDKTIPPGSNLHCLRVAFGRIEPRAGDLVVVERKAHDLVEMTCKRLAKDGENWELRCESTKPEFQEPIRIGRPDPDSYVDDGVRIVGIVVESRKSHYQPR